MDQVRSSFDIEQEEHMSNDHARAVARALADEGVDEAKRVHEEGVAAQLQQARAGETINLSDLLAGRETIRAAVACTGRPVDIIADQVRRLGIAHRELLAVTDRKLRVHQKDAEAGIVRNSDIELGGGDVYDITVNWVDMRACMIPGVGLNPTYGQVVITSVWTGVHAEDLAEVVGRCREEDIDKDGVFWQRLHAEDEEVAIHG